MKYAVYFGSRQIYGDMVTSAKSLLANSDVDKVFFLTEDDTFPYGLSTTIEVRNISDTVWQYFSRNSQNIGNRWTYIGFIRVALTKVFPDIDKILSIDADTIVDKDISDLWDIDISDYYFAAVKEPTISNMEHMLYTNVGVTMMNLKKLRDGKDDEMIRMVNTYKLGFVCQDALNIACQHHILEIPNDYNHCDYTGICYDKKVIHFAGKSNWRNNDIVKKYPNWVR